MAKRFFSRIIVSLALLTLLALVLLFYEDISTLYSKKFSAVFTFPPNRNHLGYLRTLPHILSLSLGDKGNFSLDVISEVASGVVSDEIIFSAAKAVSSCVDNNSETAAFEPGTPLASCLRKLSSFAFLSSVAAENLTPFPKIAFLFLTRGPLPLSQVWSRFFASGGKYARQKYSIYIHPSPSYTYTKNELPEMFQGRVIPSQEVVWGDISLVDAERRLLAHALLDPFNEKFVLVSESCIPLYNFNLFYNLLVSTKLSYTESEHNENEPTNIGRYNEGFLPEITRDDWRKGSQWFELSRNLALLIVEDTVYYRKFKQFCQAPDCYADEHYFQTMLYKLRPDALGFRSLTYADWSQRSYHPEEFGPEQFSTSPSLLDQIRNKYGSNCTWEAGVMEKSSNHTATAPCFLLLRKVKKEAAGALMQMERLLGRRLLLQK